MRTGGTTPSNTAHSAPSAAASACETSPFVSRALPSTKGFVITIDEADFEAVSQFRWYAHRNDRHVARPARNVKRGGKRATIFLHHEIAGKPPEGMVVDHVNGDVWDNRRANLRFCTREQNMMNRGACKGRAFGKGVYASRQRFRADIRADGVTYFLGTFDTALEAELAYDAKARELHGDFARLNHPDLPVPAILPSLFDDAELVRDLPAYERTVAALYVETGGCYFDLFNVDAWDIVRDARTYGGPHPIVAHPPCQRWGRFWHGSTRKPHQYNLGADEGCFEAALASLRKWGGVGEHPADSKAWGHFGLNKPPRSGGWIKADEFGGWTCCVDQGHYGHFANKLTWLVVYGINPADLPELIWGKGEQRIHPRALELHGYAKARRIGMMAMVGGKDKVRIRNATPLPFRDLLLSIARTAKPAIPDDAEMVTDLPGWTPRGQRWLAAGCPPLTEFNALDPFTLNPTHHELSQHPDTHGRTFSVGAHTFHDATNNPEAQDNHADR